ncbi:hypothetical protein BU16DRAFT_522520 [Lophium mytilinum]|uniref:Cation efflux protein transmembrane domain-containing protein n=1 Tax=Lophium mytilinum TaxID=390894 RepID=A0A6A6RB23_9PEZI|nr:hypothetical protein BU16DRAFT_522520 [Lophium mytilinum]
MSLRNSNGVHLFSHFGRVVSGRQLYYGPRSLPSPAHACAATHPPSLHALQLRVLRTSTKGQHRLTTDPTTLLNWSSTAHRMRHISPSAMTSTTQSRGHAGHHHHAHDNTYLVSKNKNDPGVRITRIGLYVNLGMAISKGVGGYVFNSQALSADAIHSLTDMVSDVMTLATVSLSLKPPSKRFPSGYGKFESLGSIGVSGLLLLGGVLMGKAAIVALLQQFFPEIAHEAAHWGLIGHDHHGHSHSHSDLGPNINAAWLAGGSILIKEWLYRATLKVAKERKSSVLASNAYHHRVDSLTAFVALLLIAGSNVLNNASWLDPVGGLVISLMVIQAGWGNTKAAFFELSDVGIDDEMRENVTKAATKALDTLNIGSASNNVELRSVQGVKAGQNYLMDLIVAVPASWTVQQTQGVEQLVRERLGAKVRGVKRVRVRFVTKDDAQDFMDEFIGPDISAQSSPEDNHDHDHEHDHSHDHDHEHGHEHTNGNGKAVKRK